MTAIKLTVNEDGTANLSTAYGESIHSDGFECDGCGSLRPYTNMYEHIATSATGRRCAVLWLCEECGPKTGATKHTKECDHE